MIFLHSVVIEYFQILLTLRVTEIINYYCLFFDHVVYMTTTHNALSCFVPTSVIGREMSACWSKWWIVYY
jgi:hypothetical protein